MFDSDIGLWVFWLGFSAAVGALIGRRKRQAVSGFVWGFVLGPLGWIVALLLPSRLPRCRMCGGELPDESVVKCRHCGGDIDPATFQKPKKAKKAKQPKPKPAAGLRPPGKRLR